MFDIKAEIEKYQILAREFDDDDSIGLIKKTLESYQGDVRRFAKEQLGVTSQLEELVDMLQRQEEMLLKQMDNQTALKEKIFENADLVTAIITVMDEMEYIYRLANRDHLDILSQFQAIWKKMIYVVAKAGITLLDPQGEPFDASFFVAAGINYHAGYLDGCVLEVLKSGYLYKGNLIRKAHVIVNRLNKNDEVTGK